MKDGVQNRSFWRRCAAARRGREEGYGHADPEQDFSCTENSQLIGFNISDRSSVVDVLSCAAGFETCPPHTPIRHI